MRNDGRLIATTFQVTMRYAKSETPRTRVDLKQNFENALVELETFEVSEFTLRRRTPIVQRTRKLQTSADIEKKALMEAAATLAALWDL